MLTNQRAIAHWIEEDSHTTERNSVLFSQVHSLLCCLTVLIGLVNRFNPLRATEKELSSFPLHLVQYKRRTVHQNTLIATSLRCNPLSSFFFFLFLLSEPYILLSTSSAGVFSAQVCHTAAFTSCRYWESSSVSQESHLYTEQDQHGAPPLSEAWSQRQRQTYWCIQIW